MTQSSSSSATPSPVLALYLSEYCPFCIDVLQVLEELELDVELRDVHQTPQHLRDLREATRRSTVPVLRLELPGGGVRWMPESLDIIDYLRTVARSGPSV